MKLKTIWMRCLSLLLLLAFIWITWQWFDPDELLHDLQILINKPYWVIWMFAVYLLSFILKAIAWRAYLGYELPLRPYVYGILYSLLVNHLLPLKVGDFVRIGYMMKLARKSWDEVLHSVAMLRLLDMVTLAAIAGFGIVWIGLQASWLWLALMIMGASAMLAVLYKLPAARKLAFVQKHLDMFKSKMLSARGLWIATLVSVSWLLEAVVVYGVARISSLHLNAGELIWANSVTIAGQVFQVTPGGIGTYESTLSSALVILGIGWKQAYAAAVLSHTFKFAFSFIVGGYVLIRSPVSLREMRGWMKKE